MIENQSLAIAGLFLVGAKMQHSVEATDYRREWQRIGNDKIAF